MADLATMDKKDLLTVLNDNHGIGIMMLAGTEMIKLKMLASNRGEEFQPCTLESLNLMIRKPNML